MTFIKHFLKFSFVSRVLSTLTENEEINLGVRGDNDTETTNERVHEFKEVVGKSSVPQFPNKKLSDVKTFFKQFQGSQSSCVAHTLAKICSILYFIHKGAIIKFSPGFWYRQRKNFPEQGMWFIDIQNLGTQGALIYDLLPTEGLNENEINNLKIEQYHRDVADGFRLPENWVNVPIDFDTVAATIESTNKPVMLWFRFGKGEWFNQVVPRNKTNDLVFAHSVTAVDTFTLNGTQYIRIEDSADSSCWQKDITRDFFSRCYIARYPINFKFIQGDIPTYDGTIISLQKCLLYEQFFPSNVAFVENLGPLTQKALKAFQTKYNLETTGRVDAITASKLNKLYS